MSARARLPGALEVTHRFADDFTLIIPASLSISDKASGPVDINALCHALRGQRWLLPDRHSNTGRALRAWLDERRLPVRAAMELDSFDLIISLVTLGVGVGFVPAPRVAPARAPAQGAAHQHHAAFQPRTGRGDLPDIPTREHIQQFVECILF